jgi:GntR family transcriptional repressor for pyruvate dehydrogenase complex
MALRAVQNLSLPDQVFDQIASEIINGRYSVDDNLPAERKLVETFGVNRHVVREALKRLEQLGLIRISQGGGTKVLDFRRHAGLDVLTLMADYAHVGPSSMSHWLAVHEMRLVIGADAARLCALRGSAELKASLLKLAAEMRLSDGAELFALELRFWDVLLEGADNLAYRLSFNSLLRGIFAPRIGDVAQVAAVQEIKQSGYRQAIAQAIGEGDAVAAEAAARVALKHVVDMLSVVVRGPQADLAVPAKASDAKEPAAEKPHPLVGGAQTKGRKGRAD